MKILGIHSRSLRKYVGAMHVAISVNVATKTHRLECFACGVLRWDYFVQSPRFHAGRDLVPSEIRPEETLMVMLRHT